MEIKNLRKIILQSKINYNLLQESTIKISLVDTYLRKYDLVFDIV